MLTVCAWSCERLQETPHSKIHRRAGYSHTNHICDLWAVIPARSTETTVNYLSKPFFHISTIPLLFIFIGYFCNEILKYCGGHIGWLVVLLCAALNWIKHTLNLLRWKLFSLLLPFPKRQRTCHPQNCFGLSWVLLKFPCCLWILLSSEMSFCQI